MTQVHFLWPLTAILLVLALVGYVLVWVGARELFQGIPSPWVVSFGPVLAEVTVFISLVAIFLVGRRHRGTARSEPLWGGALVFHWLLIMLLAAGLWLVDAHPKSGDILFAGLFMALMASPAAIILIGVLFPALGWSMPRDETMPSVSKPPPGAVWSPVRGLIAVIVVLLVLEPDFTGLFEHGWSLRRFGEISAALVAAAAMAYGVGWRVPEVLLTTDEEPEEADQADDI